MDLHELFNLDCGSIIYDKMLRNYYVLIGYDEETNTFVGIKTIKSKYYFDNVYRLNVQNERYEYIKNVSDNERVKILMSMYTSIKDFAPVRKRIICLKTLKPNEYVYSLQSSLPKGFYKYKNGALYHAVVINHTVVLDYVLTMYTEDFILGIVRQSKSNCEG